MPSNRIMRTPEDQEIIMRRVQRLADQFRAMGGGDPELGDAIRVGLNLSNDYIHESMAFPKPHAPKPNSPWRKILDGDTL